MGGACRVGPHLDRVTGEGHRVQRHGHGGRADHDRDRECSAPGSWIGSLPALVESDHGRLVLAKVVGAVAMLAMGLIHRRWLADTRPVTRRLRQGPAGRGADRRGGAGTHGGTGVHILRPGRPSGDPVHLVRQVGDTTVRMDVTPARSGANDVHLYFLARDGSLAAVDAAELLVSSDGVEPRRVTLTPVTPSHSVASAVPLTPGTWEFALTVVSRGTPARTTFEVPIS